MDVRTAIEKRRSIRSYTDQKLSRSRLTALAAAHLAPSARNRQEWRFIAVTDSTLIAKLAQLSEQEFMAEAP